MTTKQELHQLIDRLPEGEWAHAQRLLEALCQQEDPLLRVLDEAPLEEEPLTPEDLAAIEEGRAAVRRGDFISGEEAKRELLS